MKVDELMTDMGIKYNVTKKGTIDDIQIGKWLKEWENIPDNSWARTLTVKRNGEKQKGEKES